MRYYIASNQICSKEDVQTFLFHLTYELNYIFHPDDPFVKTNTPNSFFYNAKNVKLYNELMEKCFEVCEKYDLDIYSIGHKIQMKRLIELR